MVALPLRSGRLPPTAAPGAPGHKPPSNRPALYAGSPHQSQSNERAVAAGASARTGLPASQSWPRFSSSARTPVTCPANSTPATARPRHWTARSSPAPTAPPTESLPPSRRSGDTPPAGGDTAVSRVASTWRDRATVALCERRELQASAAANPATQQPTAEPVDVHQHALAGLFHPGHRMGFQTQLLSDKGLNEHLGSGPFVFLGRRHEINRIPGCPSKSRQTATPTVQRASTPITLFGEEPDKGLYEHLGSGPFVFLGRKHENKPTPGCPSNPSAPQPRAFKGLQLQLHFLDRNPNKLSVWRTPRRRCYP